MASSVTENLRLRRNFGKLRQVIEVPNLIDIQRRSYVGFLQDEIQPDDDLVILHQGQILRRGRASNIAGRQGLTQAFLSLTGTPA